MSRRRPISQIQIEALIRCPYCHDSIMERGPRVGCSECLAWHHTACLEELGRCGGCAYPKAESSPADLEQAVEEVLKARKLKQCQFSAPHCQNTATLVIQGMRICDVHAPRMSFVPIFLGATFSILGFVALIAFLLASEDAIQLAVAIGFGLALCTPGLLLWRLGRGVSREVREAIAAQAAEVAVAEQAAAQEQAAESSISAEPEREDRLGKGLPLKALKA